MLLRKQVVEVKKEETKCMFMPYKHNAGQNQNINIAHIFCGSVAKLKYLALTFMWKFIANPIYGPRMTIQF